MLTLTPRRFTVTLDTKQGRIVFDNKDQGLNLILVPALKGEPGDPGPPGADSTVPGPPGPPGADAVLPHQEYDQQGLYQYAGIAPVGSAQGDPVWLIRRITYNAAGAYVTTQQAVNVTWTGRTGHIYA